MKLEMLWVWACGAQRLVEDRDEFLSIMLQHLSLSVDPLHDYLCTRGQYQVLVASLGFVCLDGLGAWNLEPGSGPSCS